jgi:hypothetical protein
VAVAGRILKISSTFRRSVQRLGVSAGSAGYRAVSAATRALAAGDLPGGGDFETSFSPGRAHVRRVLGRMSTLDASDLTRRRHRDGCHRIALVGYTNAGKTSLMNALVRVCGHPERMPGLLVRAPPLE